MKIGELAARAGVSTKTIRYYEEAGVLPLPDRAPNGYRTFGESSVERLRFIRDAQATGLTLTEIASVLELRDEGEATCHHVQEMLEAHLDEIGIKIAALQETRETLAELTRRARRLSPANCTDPNRCQVIGASLLGGPT